MISLFSLQESADRPRIKHILNYRKPAFWFILICVVVIITAAILFLPNAGDTPSPSGPSGITAVSDPPGISTGSRLIPSEAEVVSLSGAFPNDTDTTPISAGGAADFAQIKNEQQLQAFFGELAGNLGLSGDFAAAFPQYDKAYFKSKQLLALIVSKDDDLDCAYGGLRIFSSESDAISKAENAIFSDIYAFSHSDSSREGYAGGIQIDWRATQREQTGRSARWLVLIGVDTRYSETLASWGQLTARWSNGFRPQLFKTSNGLQNVTYYENENTFTDTYFIKTANGARSLYDSQDRFLINGDDFMLMPHLIGVLQDGSWRLYKKAEHDSSKLIPASDDVYEELSIERYPDGFTHNYRMLAKRGGFWALLDNYGKELTDAVYDQIEYYSYEECRQVICAVRDGKYGAMDYDGNIIVEPVYVYISTLIYDDYEKDTYFVFDGNRWGILQIEADLTPNPPDWTAKVPQTVIISYENWINSFSLTESETEMSELFTNDIGFQFLGSENGSISDSQMAAYALVKTDHYTDETGITRKVMDSATMKFFGRKLTDYTDNGMTETVPGTDRLRSDALNLRDGPTIIILRSLAQIDEHRFTGQFYSFYIPNTVMKNAGPGYTLETVKQLLYHAGWEPFIYAGCRVDLYEISFSLAHDEKGTTYPIYESVKILQTDLSAPLSPR